MFALAPDDVQLRKIDVKRNSAIDPGHTVRPAGDRLSNVAGAYNGYFWPGRPNMGLGYDDHGGRAQGRLGYPRIS
jgi:hypothetical protein